MSADVAVLVAIAVLAVVTVVAAVVTVVAARRVARAAAAGASPRSAPPAPRDRVAAEAAPRDVGTNGTAATSSPRSVHLSAEPSARHDDAAAVSVRSSVLQPRVVEGRVVVPPTQDQVVEVALSRPQVRFAVVVQGVAHALRPESRDRIQALMRRELRTRRRARLRAGRRAARAAHGSSVPSPASDQWLGER